MNEIERLLNSNTGPLPTINVPRPAPPKPKDEVTNDPFQNPFAAVDSVRLGRREPGPEPLPPAATKPDCWEFHRGYRDFRSETKLTNRFGDVKK